MGQKSKLTETTAIAAVLSCTAELIAPNVDVKAMAEATPKFEGITLAAAGGGVTIEAGQRFVTIGTVAIVPIRGILTPNSFVLEDWFGWTTYHGLTQTCDTLAADESITAVILDVDSPGGHVLGLEGAALSLSALNAVKPVYVIADPMAASAAYWLASQAGEISVAPGGEIGSIGVMRGGAWPVKTGSHGWKESFHISTHAQAKMPNPETEAGLAEIQRRGDEMEARFHQAVAAGRGITVDELLVKAGVDGDPKRGGAMFPADRAVEVGLADRVETRRAFYARIFEAHKPPQVMRQGASAQRAAEVATAISQT
ncbi:MAG: S49 family peptidase [Rhodobacteraceae bacterium]|nr:S49 family peptidase [Paracoccaceae bacterium]